MRKVARFAAVPGNFLLEPDYVDGEFPSGWTKAISSYSYSACHVNVDLAFAIEDAEGQGPWGRGVLDTARPEPPAPAPDYETRGIVRRKWRKPKAAA